MSERSDLGGWHWHVLKFKISGVSSKSRLGRNIGRRMEATRLKSFMQHCHHPHLEPSPVQSTRVTVERCSQ